MARGHRRHEDAPGKREWDKCMNDADIERMVIGVIAKVSGFFPESLAGAADHDLVADLGLDSLKVMTAWAEVEKEMGFELGELGAQQPLTIRAISAHVRAGLNNKEQGA